MARYRWKKVRVSSSRRRRRSKRVYKSARRQRIGYRM